MYARGINDSALDLEKDKLAVIMDSPSPLIVSSGGGVVLSDQNRQIIKNKSLGVYIKSKTSFYFPTRNECFNKKW